MVIFRFKQKKFTSCPYICEVQSKLHTLKLTFVGVGAYLSIPRHILIQYLLYHIIKLLLICHNLVIMQNGKSRIPPLSSEPLGFGQKHDATVDIPLDTMNVRQFLSIHFYSISGAQLIDWYDIHRILSKRQKSLQLGKQISREEKRLMSQNL